MIRISDKLQLLISTFGAQAIRIGTTLIMARWIGPESNGVFYMVLAVAGIIMSLNDFSIPYSLIQITEFDEETVCDTALFLSTTLYSFYGICTLAGGVYLSHRYSDPQYWRVSAIMAVSSLLGAIYNVQLARLNRNLRFRAEGLQNLIFSVAAAVTGIVFALLHWGVYAIALQMLAGQLVANIFISARNPFRFPRKVSLRAARRFFVLGGPLSLAAYVGNVEGSIVNIFIRRAAGLASLGNWGKANAVQQLFSQNAMAGFSRVAYPLLCKANNDQERSRELFVRVSNTMMLASALLMVLLGSDSKDMIRLVLGPDWNDAAPLLRITAFAIPAAGFTGIAYIATLSKGKPRSLLMTSIINFCIFIPAVMLFSRYGLAPLAWCWAISRYFIGISIYENARRQFDVGFARVMMPIAIQLLVALSAIGLTLGFMNMLSPHVPMFGRFVLANAVGTVAFFAGIWIVQRDTLIYAFKMAVHRKQPAITMPEQVTAPSDAYTASQEA